MGGASEAVAPSAVMVLFPMGESGAKNAEGAADWIGDAHGICVPRLSPSHHLSRTFLGDGSAYGTGPLSTTNKLARLIPRFMDTLPCFAKMKKTLQRSGGPFGVERRLGVFLARE